MRKISAIGSFFSSILVSGVVFFVIYFFMPSAANQFLGLSYQSSRLTKDLTVGVTKILEDELVPKIAIDQYVERFNSYDFQKELNSAASKGEAALVELMAKFGEGIEFTAFHTAELKNKLTVGFEKVKNNSSLKIKVLQKFIADKMDSL
jgi:hypothetical protein